MCVSSDTDLGPSEEGSAGVAGGGPVVLAQLGGLEVAHAALGHHHTILRLAAQVITLLWSAASVEQCCSVVV